ncbi:MAG: hypothetical protein JWM30_2986 [Burkholderia sp.]|jgi:hypothetical protein|nr:hypothetical protein [Burkholderia sp.]
MKALCLKSTPNNLNVGADQVKSATHFKQICKRMRSNDLNQAISADFYTSIGRIFRTGCNAVLIEITAA